MCDSFWSWVELLPQKKKKKLFSDLNTWAEVETWSKLVSKQIYQIGGSELTEPAIGQAHRRASECHLCSHASLAYKRGLGWTLNPDNLTFSIVIGAQDTRLMGETEPLTVGTALTELRFEWVLCPPVIVVRSHRLVTRVTLICCCPNLVYDDSKVLKKIFFSKFKLKGFNDQGHKKPMY